MLNQSEKYNYNTNLVQIKNIRKSIYLSLPSRGVRFDYFEQGKCFLEIKLLLLKKRKCFVEIWFTCKVMKNMSLRFEYV